MHAPRIKNYAAQPAGFGKKTFRKCKLAGLFKNGTDMFDKVDAFIYMLARTPLLGNRYSYK